MSNRRYELHILLDLPEFAPLSVREYYMNLPISVQAKDDSGVDIMVPVDTHINSQTVYLSENQMVLVKGENITKFNSHIKCCMYDTTLNKLVGYYIYGRSSIYKYNITLANNVGIIDAGYRGHLINYVNCHKFNSTDDMTIVTGTRLFQICAPDLSPMSVKIVNSLPDSTRGEYGFGSTGK